ncbi:hypothetical protein LTR36_007223 [Oleoguttula mirabilis]|uniref:DUF6594 domain-containing protein n=1 Tax=Oleoguttula mirabilis TaxID=1507867 RepID=A0AAV9JAA7_9PEZI|nr:hypothetical protein LTR36_007223 [Oleoguttula mirabilis]
MSASPIVTSPVVETITEEPPSPTARRNTAPSFRSVEDPEAQQDTTRRRRPSGILRTNTNASTGSHSTTELKGLASRRSTLTSNDSTLLPCSPTLERAPTYRVDDEALHGYPKLASFLGGQEGYAIYRRFASLNARNLLYHQAKLVNLEHELHAMELGFAHEKDLHYNIHHIFGGEAGTSGSQLRRKYEEVSHALDKYNRLLLEQQKLHELPSPDSTFVDSIYNFITSDKGPKPDWLQHPENTIYAVWDDDRKPIQQDLVTLNPEFKSQDLFTKFFTTVGLDWWHRVYSRFKKPDGDFDEYVYQAKTLSRWMGAVVMIVASALPTSSIFALYFIQSAIWRLIFIMLFGGVFAAALVVFTEAKPIQVFAASVTLASVQVVFVGTALGNSGAGGGGNG